jgi:transcriptional regulator with XRE-family HTH domain
MRETYPLSGTREAVASAVRVAMARKNISGRALAEAIGMPQSRFSRRMTGEIAFDVDELAAVAAALDVPLSDFVSDVPSAGAA